MRSVVADTHAVIWHFSSNKRLSRKGRTIFKQVESGQMQVVVPSIVLVETIFLFQRARVDEAIIKALLSLSESSRATIA